jgi:hypothetical protein
MDFGGEIRGVVLQRRAIDTLQSEAGGAVAGGEPFHRLRLGRGFGNE